MPNTTGYLYAPSIVDVATLQGTAGYVVADWTIANASEQWNVEETSKIIPYTVKRTKLNGDIATQGYPQLPDWRMLLSFTQLDYFLTNKVTDRLSTNATIQTYNAYRKAWQQYTCIAIFRYEEVQTVNNTWAVNALVQFRKAVLIT